MKNERTAVALLGAIMEMSDHAQKMGGGSSISGVAALHTMQASLQKNRPRVIALLEQWAAETPAAGNIEQGEA